MAGQEQEPPRIEFPCDYPIKVLGRSGKDFKDIVLDVMRKHAPEIDESLVTQRPSGKGTFTSMTVFITATGKPQLEALHGDLMDSGLVQMVI